MDSCQRNKFTRTVNYELFVGLNDQNTNAQSVTTAQAIAFTQEVCLRYFTAGFTITESIGTNSDAEAGIATTLYIIAMEATEHSVFQVASILKKKFNQMEVLIARSPVEDLHF